MLQRLKPDEPKRVPAECVCPTGAETASRVAGVCCLITSEAMMTQCSPANVLAWVNRIFGFDHGAGHPLLFLDDAKAPLGKNSNYFNDLCHDLSNPSIGLF